MAAVARFRSSRPVAVLALALTLSACGDDGGDPDAAAARQATVDAAVNPSGVDVRRKAVDAATAARAKWGAATTLPMVPVSMANMPDGKLLMWSAEDRFAFNTSRGRTYTMLFDPATGATPERLVSETGHDMFCPGTTNLADGRLLINGGIDAANTSLYDPTTRAWVTGARMNIARGYNANTLTQDGSVLTLGGSWSGGAGNKHGEVWTQAGGWRRLPGVPVTPFLQRGGAWGGDAHMWLIPAGNGRVLHAGPSVNMHWIDTAGDGSVTPVGTRGDDEEAVTGNTVMYDVGRILKVGGTPFVDGDNGARRSAYVIDVNAGVSTRKIAPMNYARVFQNSVVLPDGKVVVIGGQTRAVGFSNDYAVLPAEIFDPVSETFTTLPAMTKPRNYHSIALLLPDGRVMSAGGGLCGANCAGNQPSYEILSPPYLFNSDGSAAARPAITGAPVRVGHGTRVRVNADTSVRAFAMVRLSSTTHAVNNDQRRVPIGFRTVSPGVFELDIPSNPGVLLAGNWMLFAMNAQGTPSIARTVLVSLDGAPVLANPGDQSASVGTSVLLAPRATDPNGRSISWSALGLPTGVGIDAATGRISGVPSVPGRYVVTLAASNGVQTVSSWFTWNVASIGAVRYLRLEALSEVNAQAWTSLAELNVLDADGAPLSRGGWTVSANSQQLPGSAATRAIDGNPATFWHTEYASVSPRHPHWIQLDLGALQQVSGVRILPRQDGSPNGIIGRYRVWGSADGASWGAPLAEGDLAEIGAWNAEKTIHFHNLALRRQASQSSTDAGGYAPRAVDGGRGGIFSVGSVTHSGLQAEPWWQVDLSASQPLHRMRVWNRTDCCGERLAGFRVFASDTDMTGRSAAQLLADPAVWRWQHAGAVSALTEVNAPTRARFVRVQLPRTDFLSLAEVEVFGWPGANRVPVWGTLPRPVLTRGVAASIAVRASDPDAETLVYTATGLPPGMVMNAASGTISGTPQVSGDYSATVIATDPRGGSARATLAIGVDEPPLSVAPIAPAVGIAGNSVTYTAVATGGTGLTYRWNFGDGTPATAFTSSQTATHTYAAPGIFTVTLTVRNAAGDSVVQTFRQEVVGNPATARAMSSGGLSVERRVAGNRLWVVNPDNNSVSVIDPVQRRRVAEIAVGDAPRALAIAPDGRVWVVNRGSASLSVIDPVALSMVATHAMPAASMPYGIVFGPNGRAWVALEATGRLVRVEANGAIGASLAVGASPRHLAITADGARVLVSRFVTPPLPGESTARVAPAGAGGEVVVVSTATMAVQRTVVLAHGNRVDTAVSGRGVPNYLGAPALSPDGRSAWVPSKQDNVMRGMLRDRMPLDFQNTVRAVSSRIDLVSLAEDGAARVDHDNSSVASAAAFHPTGTWLFVALETSRQVAVLDVATRRELMRLDAGLAPQAVAVSPDGLSLYVHNFMGRTVGIYDLTGLVRSASTQAPLLATIGTVGTERLSATVLRGKQLFYDARDDRLAKDDYMSCASCHNDGGHDGRTWDLSGFGEGLRNTTSLRGRAGGQGRLHWSANFDEVQDFEGQIRTLAGGIGLMSDAAFNAGTRRQPLGDRKVGQSVDLDALAAYVGSLNRFDASPERAANGAMTAAATAGAAVFQRLGCASCHGGADFTSSATLPPQSIGTIKASSGKRLGRPLTGIDPPTLRDVWATAPYLHDGSAPTVESAIRAHAGITTTTAEMAQLVQYVRQIGADAQVPSAEVPGLRGEYFNGIVPGVGRPAVVRNEAVDVDWGSGAPEGMPADRFSVRWTGSLLADASGNHRFQTVSDDGVRLWVDGRLVIDNWTLHGPTTDTSTTVALVAGRRYDIRLEYYENGGGATIRLRWQRPGVAAFAAIPQSSMRSAAATRAISDVGLRGQYFAGIVPGASAPLAVRNEAVDFDWGSGGPQGVPTDNFSARWVGTVLAESTGSFRFQTVSDDGVRLWVDGRLLIDNWTRHAPTTDTSATIDMVAGRRYTLRLEYYESGGGATIRLRWLRPGQSQYEPLPVYVLAPSADAPGSPVTPTPVPNGSESACAVENGLCTIPAGTSATVFYGAAGRYVSRTGVTGSIACNNATFGDPIGGTVKACRWRRT